MQLYVYLLWTSHRELSWLGPFDGLCFSATSRYDVFHTYTYIAGYKVAASWSYGGSLAVLHRHALADCSSADG